VKLGIDELMNSCKRTIFEIFRKYIDTFASNKRGLGGIVLKEFSAEVGVVIDCS